MPRCEKRNAYAFIAFILTQIQKGISFPVRVKDAPAGMNQEERRTGRCPRRPAPQYFSSFSSASTTVFSTVYCAYFLLLAGTATHGAYGVLVDEIILST